jgi:hypothetical protein
MDAEDEIGQRQLLHIADQGRKALAADVATFIISFWDEKECKQGYMAASAHKDGEVGVRQVAEAIYSVLMGAESMLNYLGQELLIRDRKTGKVIDVEAWQSHSVTIEEPDDGA